MGLLQKILQLLKNPKTKQVIHEATVQNELEKGFLRESSGIGPSETEVSPPCPVCEPEQFVSQTKTFECNSCHNWFCAKHFVEHQCSSDNRTAGYNFLQTGEGGMKIEKFTGTIGYTWKEKR